MDDGDCGGPATDPEDLPRIDLPTQDLLLAQEEPADPEVLGVLQVKPPGCGSGGGVVTR